MKWFICLAAAWIALLALPVSAQPAPALRHFVYLGQDDLDAALPILDRPDIAGARVIQAWRGRMTLIERVAD
jgi:hypothetical protein